MSEDRDPVESQAEQEADTDLGARDAPMGAMTRCTCGQLVRLNWPSKCACGKRYAYWTDGKVTKRLVDMDLGHLNNCVRKLAGKVETCAPELRAYYEVALDIFYEEIGSRDQEITQLTGIQAALFRSLG